MIKLPERRIRGHPVRASGSFLCTSEAINWFRPGHSRGVPGRRAYRSVAMTVRPGSGMTVMAMAMARGDPVRMPVARMAGRAAVAVAVMALHLDGFTGSRGLGRRGRSNRRRSDRVSLGGLAAGNGRDGDTADQGCEESATIQHGNLLGHDVAGRPD